MHLPALGITSGNLCPGDLWIMMRSCLEYFRLYVPPTICKLGTGTPVMQISAIYPHEFGTAVAQVLLWLRSSSDATTMMRFARNYAHCMPTAQDVLNQARLLAQRFSWNDVDCGWEGIEELCCPKPDRRLVKQALLRRRLALETSKKPLMIVGDSEEEEAEVSDAVSEDFDSVQVSTRSQEFRFLLYMSRRFSCYGCFIIRRPRICN